MEQQKKYIFYFAFMIWELGGHFKTPFDKLNRIKTKYGKKATGDSPILGHFVYFGYFYN